MVPEHGIDAPYDASVVYVADCLVATTHAASSQRWSVHDHPATYTVAHQRATHMQLIVAHTLEVTVPRIDHPTAPTVCSTCDESHHVMWHVVFPPPKQFEGFGLPWITAASNMHSRSPAIQMVQ